MKKSISSRVRVTKTGKILRRKMAQDHFRAKKTGKQIQGKKGSVSIDKVDVRMFKRYIYQA